MITVPLFETDVNSLRIDEEDCSRSRIDSATPSKSMSLEAVKILMTFPQPPQPIFDLSYLASVQQGGGGKQ
jgi:hypothetical protein